MQNSHRIIKITSLSQSTFLLTLERKDLSFIAGQCVNLGIPESGINREYSTYSAENHLELDFLIKEVPDGQMTPLLRKLTPGQYVEVDGAYGLFTIHPNNITKREFIFIGTGTGIAPFHSFVMSYPELRYKIIHGITSASESYGLEDYAANSYISCTSQDNTGNFSGRVTGFLRENPQNQDAIYYLCGNRNMINDVYDILREQNVSGTNIITEVFF